MNVQGLALRLRPRPVAEAADLGVRLVQQHAGSIWRIYGPLWAVACALGYSLSGVADWWPTMLLFCLKPWLDRSLLFVCSRAVFGESTRWADLWAAQRRVWWSQPLQSLLWQRLSPWRSVTLPVLLLEGQSGRALHERSAQILGSRHIAAAWIQVVYAHAEWVLVAGLIALGLWFAPPSPMGSRFLEIFLEGSSPVLELLLDLSYPLVVLVLEPFYVASGLAVYLNRRVELEAWDVEQEFRRVYAD